MLFLSMIIVLLNSEGTEIVREINANASKTQIKKGLFTKALFLCMKNVRLCVLALGFFHYHVIQKSHLTCLCRYRAWKHNL